MAKKKTEETINLDSILFKCRDILRKARNVDRFIYTAKKYLYLEKLTPTILNDMVNAVYVHAPDKSSGQRVQDVEISYNYVGILPVSLLYDLQNGETA